MSYQKNPYERFYTNTFKRYLKQHTKKNPILKKRIESVINRILENPKSSLSHHLKKERGIDLRGKRRRHVSGTYVIIYAVCDECIELGHQKLNQCSICNGTPKKRVIFFSIGHWDSIYLRECGL